MKQDTVLVTMAGAFSHADLTIPKRTEQGDLVTVSLNREQAALVINSQRGDVAAIGVQANYQLEAGDDNNSSLHKVVPAANHKGDSKPK